LAVNNRGVRLAPLKPPVFAYFAPTSLDEALALRAEHAASSVALAGGQSLLPMLNLRIARPETVIDLGRVPELAGIAEWDGGVSLGAMTRQRTAEQSELVRQRAPLVTRALGNVGHVTIRNRGTVGGSIAHADPAAELPGAALALDAQLVARSSARGERTIAAADFFQGFLTTALEPDELLVEVRVPGLPERSGVSFVEIARRHGDFAIAGAAAVVSLGGDGAIADARLVFIGVGGAPVRATEAESLLRGRSPEGAVFAEAAEQAVTGLEPASDLHGSANYRRRVAKVLARRALEEATPR
jgi:carbon-monoxide dehydrogenase medium subunit